MILSINGRKMRNKAACDKAIGNSPRTMEFTVRDVNTGRIQHMRATLRRRGVRFGVYLDNNPRGGALVTGVVGGSPATNNEVLGYVD